MFGAGVKTKSWVGTALGYFVVYGEHKVTVTRAFWRKASKSPAGVLVPTRHRTLLIFIFCDVLHVSTHSLSFFFLLHCVPLLTATSYQNWGKSSALLFYLFHVKMGLGSVSPCHEPQHFTLRGSPQWRIPGAQAVRVVCFSKLKFVRVTINVFLISKSPKYYKLWVLSNLMHFTACRCLQ